ncbi:hypothetical protein EC880221_3092, partial [Escherichia coli 88.0221]
QATLPAILVNHINQLADVWQPGVNGCFFPAPGHKLPG